MDHLDLGSMETQGNKRPDAQVRSLDASRSCIATVGDTFLGQNPTHTPLPGSHTSSLHSTQATRVQLLPRYTHTHPQYPLLEPLELSLLLEGEPRLKPALKALLTWRHSGSREVNAHHGPAVMDERNRRCIPPRLFQHPSLGFCAWRGFQACQGTVPSHVLQCCTTDNSGPEDSHRAIIGSRLLSLRFPGSSTPASDSTRIKSGDLEHNMLTWQKPCKVHLHLATIHTADRDIDILIDLHNSHDVTTM